MQIEEFDSCKVISGTLTQEDREELFYMVERRISKFEHFLQVNKKDIERCRVMLCELKYLQGLLERIENTIITYAP